LTLWYIAVLAAGMLLFGGGTWLTLRGILLDNRERELDRRLAALTSFLEREARGNNLADLREEAREYSTGLPEGHGVRVSQPNGATVFERLPEAGPALRQTAKVEIRGHHLHLELTQPLADSYRTLHTLGWVMLGLFPVVLAVAVAGGWWLARRALGPVGAMTSEARSINAADLGARLSVPPSRDELQELAEAWNELLARIEASVRSVTRFTADAAHELRTPVTVIRTSAELALRHPRTPESYQQTLRSIQHETEGMTELLERLLLLARGDAGQWRLRLDTVFLDDLVSRLRPAILSLAAPRHVTVEFEAPAEPCMIRADESAIGRLIVILADNAIKFTPEGGSVRLRFLIRASECVLEVSDTGCGIACEDLPHIFDRFYRADPARTPGNGAGLGLAIARTIAEAHSGRIEVFSEAGRGSTFRVAMPFEWDPSFDGRRGKIRSACRARTTRQRSGWNGVMQNDSNDRRGYR
jgi:heavy metal sensor kinase